MIGKSKNWDKNAENGVGDRRIVFALKTTVYLDIYWLHRQSSKAKLNFPSFLLMTTHKKHAQKRIVQDDVIFHEDESLHNLICYTQIK